MKTVKNIWSGIQRTDLLTIKNIDYVVVDADVKKNRTGSHIQIKKI